jgi:peptidoglycan hydrolase-like protein with peptidoglycan-binding domain
MDWRVTAAAVLLLAPALSLSGGPFTSLHPEEAYPDPEIPADFDPYAPLISQVQKRLRTLGFDAGPINGDFGAKTQAALAQFQLSTGMPVSGGLDDTTLAGLGVERDAQAATGATGEPVAEGRLGRVVEDDAGGVTPP